MDKRRCEWAGDSPKIIEYHDKVCGAPKHSDNKF